MPPLARELTADSRLVARCGLYCGACRAYLKGRCFLFVYWYLIRFAGESPFSHSALDLKTYAMAILGTEYRKSTKRNMPRQWFDAHPHTHVALDDAIEQGALFCNMLRQNREKAPGGLKDRSTR